MILTEFENLTGISAKDLTLEKLTDILKNPDYGKFFEDTPTFIEFLKELKSVVTDDDFKKEINSAYYLADMRVCEDKMIQEFTSFENNEITREELEDWIKTEFTSDDPVESITAYICAMMSLSDIDLKDDYNNVSEKLTELVEVFDTLGDIKNSYSVYSDLSDLIFQTNTYYYNGYGKEPLTKESSTKLNNYTERIGDFEFSVIEDGDLPSAQYDPEDMGMIDITKLGKEKK